MSFEKIKIDLSLQEMFDMVCEHAAKQMCRSTSKTAGGCAYRGDWGHKCFAGIFIPDDQYLPAMEGSKIGWIFDVDFDREELLGDLQNDHDSSVDLDSLKMSMTASAKRSGLDPSKVDLIKHWDIEEVKPYRGDW